MKITASGVQRTLGNKAYSTHCPFRHSSSGVHVLLLTHRRMICSGGRQKTKSTTALGNDQRRHKVAYVAPYDFQHQVPKRASVLPC